MPDIQRLPGTAVPGDVLRPDLVLVLRQVGRAEAGGAALDDGQAVEQDGAAGGAHGGVVLERHLGRDAAIGIGDDIEGDAQRTGDRHVEADLGGQRALPKHFEIARLATAAASFCAALIVFAPKPEMFMSTVRS